MFQIYRFHSLFVVVQNWYEENETISKTLEKVLRIQLFQFKIYTIYIFFKKSYQFPSVSITTYSKEFIHSFIDCDFLFTILSMVTLRFSVLFRHETLSFHISTTNFIVHRYLPVNGKLRIYVRTKSSAGAFPPKDSVLSLWQNHKFTKKPLTTRAF